MRESIDGIEDDGLGDDGIEIRLERFATRERGAPYRANCEVKETGTTHSRKAEMSP
jgi:hypothetical protein